MPCPVEYMENRYFVSNYKIPSSWQFFFHLCNLFLCAGRYRCTQPLVQKEVGDIQGHYMYSVGLPYT
jgi:hypothetical protein